MSLRKAVNDKCKECIYDPRSLGTWRKQVEDCTSRLCPLYHERPVQIENSTKMGQFQTIPLGTLTKRLAVKT